MEKMGKICISKHFMKMANKYTKKGLDSLVIKEKIF